MKEPELTGQRFGNLTVMRPAEDAAKAHRRAEEYPHDNFLNEFDSAQIRDAGK